MKMYYLKKIIHQHANFNSGQGTCYYFTLAFVICTFFSKLSHVADFKKSGIPLEYVKMVWTQIRPSIFSGLIWVQIVLKDYQAADDKSCHYWGIFAIDASGNFCCLLVTFANSLNTNQDRQNVGLDLDLNCLTLR